jgi:hypothetical protein
MAALARSKPARRRSLPAFEEHRERLIAQRLARHAQKADGDPRSDFVTVFREPSSSFPHSK